MAKKKNVDSEAEQTKEVVLNAEMEEASALDIAADAVDEETAPTKEDIANALLSDDAIMQAAPEEDKKANTSSAAKNRRQVLRESRVKAAQREAKNKNNAAFLSGWSSLATAFKTGRIVTGVISGITMPDLSKFKSPDYKNAVLVNVLHNKQFKVTIPFGSLYRKYPIDMSTVNTSTEAGRRQFVERQRAMAEKLYGLEIPFVIKEMESYEPGQYNIIASRSEALALIERGNFAPGRDGTTVLEVGSFAEATVISVSDYAIQVNVGGVDTRIPVHALTYRFVDGPHMLKNLYHVGDKLLVQITDVKQLADKSFAVSAARKPAELLEAQSRQGVICQENDACIGTITAILPNRAKDANGNGKVGEVFIALYIDAYDLPAVSNSFPANRLGMYAQPGDTVRVTIKKFNPNGMTYCWLRSSHGAPNLLNRG